MFETEPTVDEVEDHDEEEEESCDLRPTRRFVLRGSQLVEVDRGPLLETR